MRSHAPCVFVHARGGRHQQEEVFAPFRSHAGVGDTGGADIEQRILGPSWRIVNLLGVGVEGGVEEEGVVLQSGDAAVDAEVEKQGTGGHFPLVPIGSIVPAEALRHQVLLRVVVVAGGDDLRATDQGAANPKSSRLAILLDDALHLTVVLEPNALLLGHLDHAVHNAVHATHGIPGAEGGVRIVHQAVQRRRVLRFGPEEEHGELHQFDQPRVLEVFAGRGR